MIWYPKIAIGVVLQGICASILDDSHRVSCAASSTASHFSVSYSSSSVYRVSFDAASSVAICASNSRCSVVILTAHCAIIRVVNSLRSSDLRNSSTLF